MASRAWKTGEALKTSAIYEISYGIRHHRHLDGRWWRCRVWYWRTWLQDLPDYEDASAYNYSEKTKIYASDGTTLLAELYLENRDP